MVEQSVEKVQVHGGRGEWAPVKKGRRRKRTAENKKKVWAEEDGSKLRHKKQILSVSKKKPDKKKRGQHKKGQDPCDEKKAGGGSEKGVAHKTCQKKEWERAGKEGPLDLEKKKMGTICEEKIFRALKGGEERQKKKDGVVFFGLYGETKAGTGLSTPGCWGGTRGREGGRKNRGKGNKSSNPLLGVERTKGQVGLGGAREVEGGKKKNWSLGRPAGSKKMAKKDSKTAMEDAAHERGKRKQKKRI